KKVVTTTERRSLTNYIIQTYNATQNRACRLMRLSRSVFVYQVQTSDDSIIENNLKELAKKYTRYGFRKIFHKLKALGFAWNHKRVYRVYCNLKLNLKRKQKKRLPLREKMSLSVPKVVNQSWSLDYMSDALTNSKRFRTANVIDDYNRE